MHTIESNGCDQSLLVRSANLVEKRLCLCLLLQLAANAEKNKWLRCFKCPIQQHLTPVDSNWKDTNIYWQAVLLFHVDY